MSNSFIGRISGYEWELLESEGALAGLSCQGWYEIFLITHHVDYLERLLEFWQPPSDEIRFIAEYSHADFLSGRVSLETDTRLLHAIAKNPGLIQDISWRDFEKIVAELLVSLGYSDVIIGPGTRDHGVDVSAVHLHPLGIERIIVQCKKYSRTRLVGTPSIIQLLGTLDVSKASRGLLVTTSDFTKPAKMVVQSNQHRISVLNGPEIFELIKTGRLVTG